MVSRFIVFLGVIVLFGCGSSEPGGNDIISCISDSMSDRVERCRQTRDYADEGCDGDGLEKAGYCWMHGFPHECVGTNPHIWTKKADQCPPK